MGFLSDKRTLDALVAEREELLTRIGGLRGLNAQTVYRLRDVSVDCAEGLDTASRWSGSDMRSMQAGVAAAAEIQQSLTQRYRSLADAMDQQFSGTYQNLGKYTGAFAHAVQIGEWYTELRDAGAAVAIAVRNPTLETFSTYIEEQQQSWQHGGGRDWQSARAREIAQRYQRKHPLHRKLYDPAYAVQAAAGNPQWYVDAPARVHERDVLIWVERKPGIRALDAGIWEDLTNFLKYQPSLYRHAELAAVRLPANDLDRVLQMLEREFIAGFRERDIAVYVAPASLVSIPARIKNPVIQRALRSRSMADLYNLENIGAHEAWQVTQGQGASVAVIDTGIDYTHRELSGRVPGGYNFVEGSDDAMDDNEHGTHVAGIIAGNTRGVAPAANVYALKVLNGEGYGSMADVLRAMEWVMDHNASGKEKICAVNLSLGSSSANRIEELMCQKLYQSGVAVIAAAGNESRGPSYPAAYPNVLSVAAVDRDNDHAWFSNIWNTTDISAPGVNVNSSVPSGYSELSGTSMATPHIAGIAALAAAIRGFDPAQFETLLKQRAMPIGIGEDEHDAKYGAGLGRADRIVAAERLRMVR